MRSYLTPLVCISFGFSIACGQADQNGTPSQGGGAGVAGNETSGGGGSSAGTTSGGAGGGSAPMGGASAGAGGNVAGAGGAIGGGAGMAGAGGTAPTLDASVVAQMRKVADWQLPRVGTSKDWIHGAMWTGIFATYEVTQDQKYLDAIKTWAGDWSLTGGATARGDNQCAAQTYFDVFLLDPKPANQMMVDGAKLSFDAMLTENKTGRVEWWWQDALFMVPPGFVRLSKITGDNKYIDKMNTLYWDTYAFLWSDPNKLMYRDDTRRTDFWARGCGWVVAGAARVLEYLPENDPKRANFVQLLKDMSGALAAAQGMDGLWRANILKPDAIPNPETSGTGFFTYGMAWGINHGILDSAQFKPVVAKAWAGLNSHVDADGKLGFVQPVGAGPAAATADSTVEYGVGAYLLAGSEVARLAP